MPKSNRYFLWDGCEPAEMRKRLNLADFRNINNPVIEELIEETSVLQADLTEKNKGELITTLQNKLNQARFDRFIEDLFESVGKKGNQLNLQFYFGSGFDYQELVESLEEEVNEADPEEVSSYGVSNRLFDYEAHEDGSAVDLLFKIHEVETTEVPEGTDIDEDVLTGHQIRDVECRVYVDKGVLAISNSGLDKEKKNRIRTVVSSWADGTSSPSTKIKENELLALQNLFNGENSGLDFGEFRDKNIRSAKYRGARAEALARSRVVSPAQETGEITQIRFYHVYTGSTEPVDVQVRVHQDGHITTTQPTEPDFVNTFVDHLLTVREYRDHLERVNDVIDEFVWDIYKKRILDGEKEYKSRKIQALEDVVLQFTDLDDYEDIEIQAFQSALLNVSRNLVELEIERGLDSSRYPSPPVAAEDPSAEQEFKGLLDDIAEFDLDEPNYDFATTWNHLYNVMDRSHQSPITIIEVAVDEYNI